MPAQLLSLTEGPTLLLDKPVLLLGRHAECDIQLNSRKVSRKHCCIAQVSDHLIVRDLGSTNGVRINGTRVKEGILRNGDELTIGNFRYQIHTESERGVLPPPVPAAKPARRAHAVPDEMLESSDEPVPLPEIPGVRVPAARRPGRLDKSYPVPENIQLAPSDHPSSVGPAAGPAPG
jgi:predicted component of type VI protein secretion system